MTTDEITAAGTALILAGSETTAGALCAATVLLLSNPDKMRRARDEVDTAFGSETEITLKSTLGLKYLLAVIEESLRMYPPVPVRLPRRTRPDSVEIIDGHLVPGGVCMVLAFTFDLSINELGQTSIGTHQWSSNRSPRNFTDPDSFIPERWLKPPPDRYADDDLSAVQPFSQGPRNCLGRKSVLYSPSVLRVVIDVSLV